MMTLETVRGKRGRLLDLAARHGARNLRVFGSVARGEADAASDLDLLVDLEPGRSLIDLGALLADLEAELGTRGRRGHRGGAATRAARAGAARRRAPVRDSEHGCATFWKRACDPPACCADVRREGLDPWPNRWITLEYLRRLDGKLDDVRADLDEVRAALRSLEDRQLGVERSIGLVREDMARRDRRSDALG